MFAKIGEQLLINKQCAILVLAGGAATRLGAEVPKGAFQLDLDASNTNLYQIILNKCATMNNPRVIFMLSSATVDTIEFLKTHQNFGYKGPIEFCFQPEYPVVAATGQLLLDQAGQILKSPNGNGGFLKALEPLELREQFLHVVGVDNPFVRPCDPEMLGFALQKQLDVVNRVLRPLAGEKVGIAGQKKISAMQQAPLCSQEIQKYFGEGMVPTVFEYSEIDLTKINPVEQYANIVNHLFSVKYLKELMQIQVNTQKYITPYHLAFKKVPYFDLQQNKMINPEQPNAYKMEHFIFDYFHFCPLDKFGLFVCPREEFVPIKEMTDIEKVRDMWVKQK